jgi:Protein of unknown function (DUF3592)
MLAGMAKAVGVVLIIASMGFGAVGVYLAAHLANVSATWRTFDAVVDEVSVAPLGENKYWTISVGLHYRSVLGERLAWFQKTPFKGGEKFAQDFAVGTHHQIWVDPDDSRRAEVLGWNINTFFAPLLWLALSAGLMGAARYYWRLR